MSKPAGFHTVAPCLMLKGTAHAEFYKQAFGATEVMRQADPDSVPLAPASGS